ncbi:hypothetical protein [Kribbella sp. C-35]|uniref:hypothetical protein n=1 Tax=Kribbella sp. C-35 TaxID=2789276 RepID=UPI00397CE1A3
MNRRITQAQSHARLLLDASVPLVGGAKTPLDAIVVPTARPASALQPVINLSVEVGVPLVILCSRQARLAQVVGRVEKTFGAQALVIQVDGYQPRCMKPLTSAEEFQIASAGRSSDLSAKRNIGLLLGRLRGWNKILFLDDDLYGFNTQDVSRLSGYLDNYPVASLRSWKYPDNSVVCHARRRVGFKQDVFVSGAALGVNLQHPDQSFFADIYNEDWFFFARHAARRRLPNIGKVSQQSYEPFADPQRAAREEFGDLLAEGLYLAFHGRGSVDEHLADALKPRLWEEFKEARLETIQQTAEELERVEKWLDHSEYDDIKNSLRTANEWAETITPDLCVNFIDSWQEDERSWQLMLSNFPSKLNNRDALAELELSDWTLCGYGLSDSSQSYLAPAGAV